MPACVRPSRVPSGAGYHVAAGTTWVVAAVATFVILKVLDVVMGLRPSQREEIQGLDLSQHGETALGTDLLGGPHANGPVKRSELVESLL